MTEEQAKDLTTAQGARNWLEMLKDLATKRFEEFGQVDPMVLFIATRNQEGKTIDGPPAMIMAFIDGSVMEPTGDGKDKLALWIRRYARLHDAIGFAFLTEGWMLSEKKAAGKVDWANVPGRQEGLCIFAQHKALGKETHALVRMISRDGGGPQLGTWSETAGASGRFADVLMSEEDRDHVEDMVGKMVEIAKDWTPEKRRQHLENSRERLYAEDGVPRPVVDAFINKLIARLEEVGSPVAPLSGEPPKAEAKGEPTVGLIDVDEWGRK